MDDWICTYLVKTEQHLVDIEYLNKTIPILQALDFDIQIEYSVCKFSIASNHCQISWIKFHEFYKNNPYKNIV